MVKTLHVLAGLLFVCRFQISFLMLKSADGKSPYSRLISRPTTYADNSKTGHFHVIATKTHIIRYVLCSNLNQKINQYWTLHAGTIKVVQLCKMKKVKV